MQYFKKYYAILALDEGIKRLSNNTLPPNALAITFDDGYRNFYTYAFPILKKLNIPATIFLATDFVLEKKPLWVDRLEYAGFMSDEYKLLFADERKRLVKETERRAGISFTDFEGDRAVYAPLELEEIREMQTAGIAFGAHSRSHSILSRIPQELIEEEVAGSKHALEEAGIRVSVAFAYPNGQAGDWNETVEKAVEKAGFTAALTTVEGVNKRGAHPLRLKRIAMDGTDNSKAFAVIASGVRGLLQKIRHGQATSQRG